MSRGQGAAEVEGVAASAVLAKADASELVTANGAAYPLATGAAQIGGSSSDLGLECSSAGGSHASAASAARSSRGLAFIELFTGLWTSVLRLPKADRPWARPRPRAGEKQRIDSKRAESAKYYRAAVIDSTFPTLLRYAAWVLPAFALIEAIVAALLG
jgi:hypothetical protein